MRKFTQLLTLAALMIVPWVASGQSTLTVADGTSTNSYVPFYGYMMDANQHNQILYPADSLTAISGKEITSITFYFNGTPTWNSATTVSLGTTSNATLGGLNTTATFEQVWTGSISCANNQWVITFAEPYAYTGGNLIIDLNSVAGQWNSASSYGVSLNGAAYCYNSQRDFLPKTTFGFQNISSCPKPASASVSGIDSNNATINWIDNLNSGATYTIRYWAEGSTDTTYISGLTGSSYSLSGLNAATTYHYGVAAYCTSSDSSSYRNGTFKTTCGTVSVPYSTGFEGLSTGAQPDCWDAIVTGVNGSNTFPCAYSYAQNTHTGSIYYEFESGSGSSNVEIAALPVMENINTLKMTMWVSSSSSYPCMLEVGVMEDTAFVPIDTLNIITFSGSSNWKQNYNEYTTYFANYTGTGNRIAIRATRTGSGQFTLFIDDVTVDVFSGCFPAEDLHANAIDSTNITLAWADNFNSGATYTVYYCKEGTTDTIATYASDTTITLSGLDANSVYNIAVVTNCTIGDASPIEATYRTECGAMTMPFFDNFDSYANGQFPPCWQRIRAHGTDPSVNNQFHHSGNQSMFLLASSDTTLFVTPTAIPLDGNNIFVRYHAYMNYSSYSTMTKWIKAGVMTDPNNMSTFIALDSLEYHNFNNVFEEREFATTALDPDSAYYVAWMYYCNYSYTNTGAIDDIYISEIPSCLRINSLAITDADSESVTLVWVDSVNNGATYTILVDNTVVADGISDSTYTVTGLAASSAYTFGVQVNCGSEDAEVVSITGRTECGTATLPFVESFEETTGNSECWTLDATSNIGGNNGMGFITLNGHRMLRFSSYSNATDYNQYGYSPRWEDASAYNTLHVRVRYATYGGNDKLNFGYITPTDTIWDPTDYTTGGNSDFQYYEAFIPTSATKLAFHYYGDYSYYAWIDSVMVNPVEGTYCYTVSNPTVTDITADGATIHWVADASQSTWLVRIDSTIYSVNDTTYTINGLDARTTYTVYLAADCSVDTSDWISVQFTTDCANGSCDVTVDMTDGYGDGWNGNAVEVWQNGTLAGSATLTTGNTGTATINVCSGTPTEFRFHSGSYPDEVSFTIYDGGAAEIYTAAIGDMTNVANGTVLDSLENACPSCITPDSLVLTLVDSMELEFAWRVIDSVYGYIVSFNGGSWESAIGTYNAFGLTPNTSYTFSVKAICTPGDTSNARTITVKTSCGQMTLPFVEGFENDPAGNMPSCWSTLTGTPAIAEASYSIAPHSGNQHLQFSGNGMAITSAVPLNGDSIYVSFWAAMDDYYSITVEAGVMTNPLDDSTFIPMLTLVSGTAASDYTLYEFNTASLFNYYDSTFYVAFRTNGNNYAQAFIDDINIRLNEGCMYPSNVVATPGAHDISLTWSNTSSTADFVVSHRASGAAAWDTTVYVNDTVYTITGLNAATQYEVRVGFLCNADTLWTNAIATTNCDVVTLPYFENFYSATGELPPCWTYTSPVGWNNWPLTSGNGELMFGAYSAGVPAVLPQFTSNFSKLQITFYTKCRPDNEGDGILIGVADAAGNLISWIDTLYHPNHSQAAWVEHTYNFLNYSGPGARIALGRKLNGPGNLWCAIDSITVIALQDCVPVDSLRAFNLIDPDHTSFTWQPQGYETSWQVYVDTVTVDIATVPDSMLTSVSTTSYEIPMGTIQGGGIYKFYVRADCSIDHSNWVSYEFGAGTVIMNNSATADTVVACGMVVYDNGGPVAGYLDNSNSALVIRSENAGSELEIFGGKFGWGESSITLTVYDGEGTSGAQLYQITNTGTTNYTLDSILATSTTGAMTITFTCSGNYVHTGYELYIHCVGAALCERPTQLNAVMTEVGEANVSWTGTSAAYDLYYKPTGATNWTIQSTTANNVVLTGLIPDTTYDMQVVGICGTDTSTASFPIVLNTHYSVVITPCNPVSDLTVSGVTNTTATLSWTSDGNAWEIEVVRVGNTDTVVANTNPYTLTGLLPNMQYTVRVRTACSGVHVDPYSDWSATETFTTPFDGPQTYTLNVVSNNDAWGTVTGGGTYAEGATATLTATANDGYYFDRWNDGDTNATRTVTVTGDATYTANFAENGTHNTYYTVSVSANNPEWGTVTGAGEYVEGSTCTITATANSGYHFVDWNDGVTDAVRTFTVTEPMSFVANFAANTGIDNVDSYTVSLYPNPASSTVTVRFDGVEGMVEIVDISGRTNGKWMAENGQLTIDVSALPAGAYFVRVTGEKGTAVSRLIVR